MTGHKSVSTIAFNWRIERRDGVGVALTSHDEALVRDGVRYRSDPGVMPAATTRRLGLEPSSGEVSGVLSSNVLTEADLMLGRWAGARVTLTAVDWEDAHAPETPLTRGEVGEVSLDGEAFSADLRGAASRLSESVCPSTSPECRAELGDRHCRIDLAGRSIRARVLSVEGSGLKLDQPVNERFLFGRLRFLEGENCSAWTVVLAVENDIVRLRDLPRAAVLAGTRIELREGCDKRFATCVERFGNAVNFRGEPHLPGNDLLTRYPGA